MTASHALVALGALCTCVAVLAVVVFVGSFFSRDARR